MLYMHPKSFLWMMDQDRERAMHQRALERRLSDHETDPGLARGGISFTRWLRGLGSAITGLGRPTTSHNGSQSAW